MSPWLLLLYFGSSSRRRLLHGLRNTALPELAPTARDRRIPYRRLEMEAGRKAVDNALGQWPIVLTITPKQNPSGST